MGYSELVLAYTFVWSSQLSGRGYGLSDAIDPVESVITWPDIDAPGKEFGSACPTWIEPV